MNENQKRACKENWLLFQLKGMIGTLDYYSLNLKEDEYNAINKLLLLSSASCKAAHLELKRIQAKRRIQNENSRKLSKK